MDNKELASRLFPDVEHEPQYYLDMYPERNLPEGAIVTRFAPSPTGYMHIGNLRTALYEYLIAKANGGSFILRIEDTDQKRYVEGATDIIYSTLKTVGMNWDEGPDIGGNYGVEIVEVNWEEESYSCSF